MLFFSSVVAIDNASLIARTSAPYDDIPFPYILTWICRRWLSQNTATPETSYDIFFLVFTAPSVDITMFFGSFNKFSHRAVHSVVVISRLFVFFGISHTVGKGLVS